MTIRSTMRAAVAATAIAALALSCVSGPAPEKAEPQAKTERPTRAKFSRVEFGEKLSALLAKGEMDAALALFDSLPQDQAEDPNLRALKLSVLISAGRLDEGTTLARELEAAYPTNPDVLYAQAVLAGVRGDRAARTGYLERALKADPTNGMAMTGLGLDYYGQKNYPLAKTWLLKALAAEPGNVEALLGLARVQYMQGDLEACGGTLALAIERDPSNSVLWAERARVKSESNDLPGAVEDVSKAAELDPSVYGHWADLGSYCISLGRQKEAAEAFTRAIELDPNIYIAYVYRAGLNDDLGRREEAIADYRAAISLYPQYYFAFESLGVLLWETGDYASSAEAFEKALIWNPKNISYALMYTLCLYRQGKADEAKRFMGKYITTLDRTSTEYFLCRLFVDRSGDADVLNRIVKEKNMNKRNRMLFYSANFYELFQSKSIAQKYYYEILATPAPSFFEYRLSKKAIKDLETKDAT